MKRLKCHCGSIEANINIKGDLEKILIKNENYFNKDK